MATLQEILARAQALREETALGSISPERVGSIMFDTLLQIAQNKGTDGVGFEDISTAEDGSMVITLTDGSTITIDLNHEHPQYPKYVLLADEAAYEALATKDPDTLYLIPESE